MTKEEARNILNLGIEATENDIKNAFRKLAKQYHPDISQNDEKSNLFLEAHEAYEILLGKRKETLNSNSNSNKASQKFRNSNYYRPTEKDYKEYFGQDYEERLKQAKKAAAEMEEQKSEKIYQKVFDEYLGGWQKVALKYIAYSCLLFVVLLLGNRFYPLHTKNIQSNEYDIAYVTLNNELDYILYVKNQEFAISEEEYYFLQEFKPSFKISYSLVFKDIISIEFDETKTIDTEPYRLFFNVYRDFYIYVLLFLLPIFSYFYERPSFNFLFFGVYGSIYIIPILFIGIFLHENRFLRIFGI